MASTLEIVRKLSDLEASALASEVFNAIYQEIPHGDVRSISESSSEVSALVSLDSSALQAHLPAAESSRLARAVLEQYAGDPALAPVVQDAWERMRRSDKLPIVEAALALGLLVNLTLLVATTEVRVKKGKDGKKVWSVTKGKPKPALVKAIVGPMVAAAKALF